MSQLQPETENTLSQQIVRTVNLVGKLDNFIFGERPQPTGVEAMPVTSNGLQKMLIELTEANHQLQGLIEELRPIK